ECGDSFPYALLEARKVNYLVKNKQGVWGLPKISFRFETDLACGKITGKVIPTCYACRNETRIVRRI
ncbi:hypothetical protein, partial [Streptococcus sp. HMSC056D07]|uniref:hypothetical protein n=1 Tax=Streptococcus sp. HMSC056D07 TaxID=1739474 RepID=UPI001C9A7E28